MMASRKVTSSRKALLPQTSQTTVTVQRDGHIVSALEKHEKLCRLGEAVTDVLCAGAEAIVDKWGTQGMSKAVHSMTKNVQTSSEKVFQAPYARLQALLLEQQAKFGEQSILVAELRSAVSTGEAELGYEREQVTLLQQALYGSQQALSNSQQALSNSQDALSSSQQENTTLRETTETLTVDLKAAREQAGSLATDLQTAHARAEQLEAELEALRNHSRTVAQEIQKETAAVAELTRKPSLTKPRQTNPRRQSGTSPWGLIAATFISQPSTPQI